MDDVVKQAMAKWPNVPDCYGWLGLDARGDWYMRDDQAQALGTFTQNKGSRLAHEKLIEFINRNYASDKQGQWFFQNGPQRVYVEIEATPWIWRLQTDGSVQVLNSCATADGSMIDALGKAHQVGAANSPKLKVRFAPAWLSWLPQVWGDYWVIDLDADYQLAAVSDAKRVSVGLITHTAGEHQGL
jgi:lipocalin